MSKKPTNESMAVQSKIREFLIGGPKSNMELLEHTGLKLGTLQWHIQKMELLGHVTLERRQSGRGGRQRVLTHLTVKGRARIPHIQVERSLLRSGACDWWKYSNIRTGSI